MVSEDDPRESLLAENADGSVIAIKNFVMQAHQYLTQHKDMLICYRKFHSRGPPPRMVRQICQRYFVPR
jgi:hypothetical protein